MDTAFIRSTKTEDVIIAGDGLGNEKLIKHPIVGLVETGIKIILVKLADRRFFRIAMSDGLWIVIAPEIVAEYKVGDIIDFIPQDGCLYLNGEKFVLPEIDAEFIAMVENKVG